MGRKVYQIPIVYFFTILDIEFKKIKWFFIIFAIVVGISRMYFNVHFFSDVVGGALLGYIIGDIFYNLEKKYKWF